MAKKGRMSWPNKRPHQPLAKTSEGHWDSIFGEREHKTKGFARYVYRDGEWVNVEKTCPDLSLHGYRLDFGQEKDEDLKK